MTLNAIYIYIYFVCILFYLYDIVSIVGINVLWTNFI